MEMGGKEPKGREKMRKGACTQKKKLKIGVLCVPMYVKKYACMQ